jgi:predicted flap endonuclease-1-like 5' DNA nuclease
VFGAQRRVLIALASLAIVAALIVGFVLGRARREGPKSVDRSTSQASVQPPALPSAVAAVPAPSPPASAASASDVAEHGVAERARLIRSYEAEGASLRRSLRDRDVALTQLADFATDRRQLFEEVAQARTEAARYRQLVIDCEEGAPPPLLGAPGTPDNLKMIVGVGPVLERMLYQLGITTYRQIARWSDRDIDEVDAKLPEFPGRIRRDDWVTQARALHESTYGESLPRREPR